MKYLEKKKLAFMSIVNQIKGFVRTVTGVPPLTLPDCVDNNSIINYTIDGNSIQDGEPTPENPVEVECVGELTKNMFDMDGFCAYYNSFGNSTLKANANDSYLGEKCYSYFCKYPSSVSTDFTWQKGAFKENTQYTISGYASFEMSNIDSRAVVFAGVYYTDGTASLLTFTLYRDKFSYFSFTTQSGKTINYIGIPNFAATAKVYIKDFQLEEGTTATDYEPYGKYKIPVKCSGKNLMNTDDWVEQLKESITNASYPIKTGVDEGREYFAYSPAGGTSDLSYKPCQFKENTIYTISFYVKMNKNSNILKLIYTNGEQHSIPFTGDGTWKKITCVTYSNHTLSTIITTYQYKDYVYISDFQIEEGKTATDYEPYVEPTTTNIYLDEPLRKVGSAADFIDFENQKVVRKTYCEKLNSTNLKELAQGTTSRFYKPVSKSILSSYRGGYGNCFKISATKYNNELSNNEAMLSPSAKNIYIRCDDLTLDEYKQLLDSEDVLIYYALAEETETPITLPKLPTFKGTTIYSIDTQIQPSNMSATYYSTAKE